jgi:general secretion pathway protein H
MGNARGFTLIELLVVIVIMGSLLSLAVLSSGTASHARELRDEAQRLASIIGLLSDEAVLDNREYGLLIRAEGYRLLSYDEARNSWSATDGQAEHLLPAWARLELELDGQPLQLAAALPQGNDLPGLRSPAALNNKDKQNKQDALQPQLLLLSSGELSPFRLRVSERQPGRAFELSSDGFQRPRAELVKEKP